MVALVTGSSKGIGSSTIEVFAKNGYDVVINYNTDYKSALELKKYIIDKYKVKATIVKCDISNEIEVSNMINSVLDEFSNIDILINNAGIALDNEIMNKTKDEFMRVLEVNVVGTFLVTKEILNKCKVNTIINVSSTDSIDTYNEISIDYSISKSGINLFTKILSDKYKNIKVCAVLPNWVDTASVKEMDPVYLSNELKRINQRELIRSSEVADMIYKIVVDDSIKSGSFIRIDKE